MALELAYGDLSKVTAEVMKQAVQNFKGELEEEDEPSDDGSEEAGSDYSEDDQTDDDSFDDDDEGLESPATRGRQKVTPQELVEKGNHGKSKFGKYKDEILSKISELKTYTTELQNIVKEMESEVLD